MRIAIVGAGPVGSWIAWKLSELGEDVTVIERKPRPGEKACSGLVSERIWDFIPKRVNLVENKINAIAIHFPKKTVEVKFRQCMLAMDREKFDAHVAGLAGKAGARMMFGSTFKTMHEHVKSVGVEWSHNSKLKRNEFDRLIGCDGALSPVRRALGLPEPRYRTGLQCYQPAKDCSRTAEAWPVRNGFFWRIPRGRKVEWGLFGSCKHAAGMWKEFAANNGLEGLGLQSALIPESVITTGSDKVVLCGDAAGLTKPWSGGGLVWGLTSAKLLLGSWPDFKDYEEKVSRMFSNKMSAGRAATRMVGLVGKTFPWVLPGSMDSDWLF